MSVLRWDEKYKTTDYKDFTQIENLLFSSNKVSIKAWKSFFPADNCFFVTFYRTSLAPGRHKRKTCCCSVTIQVILQNNWTYILAMNMLMYPPVVWHSGQMRS